MEEHLGIPERSLHNWGLNLNICKSILKPTNTIDFCGIRLDFTSGVFELVPLFNQKLRETLLTKQCTRRGAGILAYTLYTLGLSSAWRFLYQRKQGRTIWGYLQNGRWPIPRPLENFIALDATTSKVAAVNERAQIIFAITTPENQIYRNELTAALFAALLAPSRTMIFCDNTAIIGAARRSRTPSWLLLQLSIIKACKDIQLTYISSACNPADSPTRDDSSFTPPSLREEIKTQMREWTLAGGRTSYYY